MRILFVYVLLIVMVIGCIPPELKLPSLPRGPKGERGKQGIQGPPGKPGKGLSNKLSLIHI